MILTAEKITAAGADLFLAMARDFHIEDGEPLTAAGEAAVRETAAGVALAPSFFLLENGNIIGFFALSLGYSMEHGGADGFIDDLYLLPPYRGRGLGRQAVALALEESRKCGVMVLLLEVEAHNSRAYGLYTSMGFTDTRRRLLRLVLPND